MGRDLTGVDPVATGGGEPGSAAWYESLPRTRTAAAALLTDERGRLLAVEPTYRSDGWGLPGGLVERNEAPRLACRREVSEELGLDLDVGPLRSVGWSAADPPRDALVLFLYDGATLSTDQIEAIRLPPDELRSWAFLGDAELLDRLYPRLAAQVRETLRAGPGTTIELQDGRPVG